MTSSHASMPHHETNSVKTSGSMQYLAPIFLYTGRVSPQDITITPTFWGSSLAIVKWTFAGDDRDLFRFNVQVDGREDVEVRASDREAEVRELLPSATNHVTVTAVYKDGRQTECSCNYQNDSKSYIM